MKSMTSISEKKKDFKYLEMKKANFIINVNLLDSEKREFNSFREKERENDFDFKDLQKKNLTNLKKKTLSSIKSIDFEKNVSFNKITLNVFLNHKNSKLFCKENKIFKKKKIFSSFKKKKINCEKKSESKLFYFNNLITVISDVFKNKKMDFSLIQKLDIFEIEIILTFIKKKFKKKYVFQINKISLENLKKKLFIILENIQIEESLKRIEEKNRFIFNFTFKKLKSNYLKKDNHHMSNDQNREFLFYYFKNFFKKNQIPPENIFSLEKSNLLKILNNEVLYLLFQSKIFYKDFFFYVKNYLLKDYEILITKKFDKVFLEFENMINKNFHKKLILKNFNQKMKNNNRVKFPWNFNEVDNAIFHFSKHIDKLLTK